jgi:hypothetical protein
VTEEIGDRPAPPLPWEHKAAIGCLVLLALQAVHEIVGFFVKTFYMDGASLGPFSALLLVLYFCTGLTLRNGSERGWWTCVAVNAGLGLFHLALFASTLHATWAQWHGEHPGIKMRILEPFGFIWVLSRTALLLGVPVVLGLGAIRKSLRAPQP